MQLSLVANITKLPKVGLGVECKENREDRDREIREWGRLVWVCRREGVAPALLHGLQQLRSRLGIGLSSEKAPLRQPGNNSSLVAHNLHPIAMQSSPL